MEKYLREETEDIEDTEEDEMSDEGPEEKIMCPMTYTVIKNNSVIKLSAIFLFRQNLLSRFRYGRNE